LRSRAGAGISSSWRRSAATPATRVCIPAAPSFVAAAATTTGTAARNRDAFKRTHYARRGLGGGYELMAVSVEYFRGRQSSVADVAADGGGIFKAAFIESALQGLSVTLAKRNGRMLRAHLSRVARASGRVYLRGLPVPVAEVSLEC
jgi:hypothetical protein